MCKRTKSLIYFLLFACMNSWTSCAKYVHFTPVYRLLCLRVSLKENCKKEKLSLCYENILREAFFFQRQTWERITPSNIDFNGQKKNYSNIKCNEKRANGHSIQTLFSSSKQPTGKSIVPLGKLKFKKPKWHNMHLIKRG